MPRTVLVILLQHGNKSKEVMSYGHVKKTDTNRSSSNKQIIPAE
jgi:hypothetical protein